MFCPVCKAEYRPGFTRCSDCDAALVETLDAANSARANQDRDLDAVLLWSGTDSQTFVAVRDALDWGKILHFAQTRAGGVIPGLGGEFYSVLVHRDDRNAAEAVLETIRPRIQVNESADDQDSDDRQSDVLDVEDEEDESAQLEESDDGAAAPDDIADDFKPDEASAEIWSSDDRDLVEMIQMSLRENGIGCVLENRDGKQSLRVMPAAEARGKEIVREILEGAPPR